MTNDDAELLGGSEDGESEPSELEGKPLRLVRLVV